MDEKRTNRRSQQVHEQSEWAGREKSSFPNKSMNKVNGRHFNEHSELKSKSIFVCFGVFNPHTPFGQEQ
jgi:hypothetical protein